MGLTPAPERARAALVGREEELGFIEKFLSSDRQPLALVIEGDPGIGKSTLWQAAVDAAHERSFHVLACRPTEAEAPLAFAALGDLVEPVLEETLPDLPAPQQRALRVALLLEESHGPPPDQRAIGLAVLGILRLLAAERPVLVAVDDVQWLDASTSAALQFALRRVLDEPIALLAAARPEGAALVDDLARGSAENRIARLAVGPLSVGAMRRLLRSRLDVALSRPILLRVHEASRGNPFYALELARALSDDGRSLTPGQALPVAETLHGLLLRRIGAFPASVQDLLSVVSILADPTIARAAAARAGSPATKVAIETAVAAGIIELRGERIMFTHPLLREAVYARAPADTRRALHSRLATVVDDLEERTRHRALGTVGPDAGVADSLDEAARHAAARGAPAVAAELSELAVARTPADRSSDVHRRILTAAEHHLTASDLTRGRALLAGLLDAVPPGGERADVLLCLGARSASEARESIELLERALVEAADDPRRLARIESRIATFEMMTGHHLERPLAHAKRAVAHAERSGDSHLLGLCLARLAMWEMWAADVTPGLLNRALAFDQAGNWGWVSDRPHHTLGLLRAIQGHVDEARQLLEAELAGWAAHGDERACVTIHRQLALVEWRAGAWDAAAAHAKVAYDLVEEIGIDAPEVAAMKAFVDVHRGNAAEARAASDAGTAVARRVGLEVDALEGVAVNGVLELPLGDTAAADRHLRPLAVWHAERGWALATTPLAPYALEAMIRVGDVAEAGTLLARFEREGRALESPWVLAAAARLRGLLLVAGGDLDGGVALLRRALAEQDGRAWPFERALTLLALGAAQRRAKQKRAARESLGKALSAFEALGATPWADAARAELARIGGRTPSRDELTPTERRVAALVAEGRSNAEVAAALVVAPRTVEWNLSKIYRKLGVRSRAELAHRFAGKAANDSDGVSP